ncbi:MAG: glycosyltransferase, partial [Bacteroidetes bacterium]|nr:glycosyltransferase [Bacteroidota bacterium]
DWGNQVGDHIRKYHPDVQFEVWQPDFRADKVYSHTFESGVTHRLFPARSQRGGIFSEALLAGLEERAANRTEQLVIQVSGRQSLLLDAILRRLAHRAPVLTQFLGALNFIDANLDFRVWRWPQRIAQRNATLEFIREKQKYILISGGLPLEPAFREKIATPSHLVFSQHTIGLPDSYFHTGSADKEELRKKWGLPPENKVFLSSSRLVPLKQIDKIVKAFGQGQMRAATLLITGAGPQAYVDKVKRLIDKQDADIRFLGFVGDEELWECYRLSDVFIDASANDGGPISGWKAMAMNLGVITTATGNVGTFLKQHNAGVLIPQKEANRWAAVLQQVASGQLEVRRIPVEKVRKVKSWAACADNMMQVYKTVLQDHEATGRQERNQHPLNSINTTL